MVVLSGITGKDSNVWLGGSGGERETEVGGPAADYLEVQGTRMKRVMVRTVLTAAILAGASALAQAQSASAPLVVTATVVSFCIVDVPTASEAFAFATLPVAT